MSIILIYWYGFSETGSSAKYCNSLLLQVLCIEPPALKTDRHSAVTLQSSTDSGLIRFDPCAMSNRSANPAFFHLSHVLDYTSRGKWIILTNLSLLFLWIVAVSGFVLVKTRSSRKVSTRTWPSCSADDTSLVSVVEATRPYCREQSVGFD